jgi:hypothetical protein
MNKENIKKLITFLKKLPDKKFNMELTSNDCGTIGCIAGWAMALQENGKSIPEHDEASKAFYTAGAWLGLTYANTQLLFNPFDEDYYERPPKNLSKAQAINVLTHLMKTGKVAWHKNFGSS